MRDVTQRDMTEEERTAIERAFDMEGKIDWDEK
jgi:hypothetical protein